MWGRVLGMRVRGVGPGVSVAWIRDHTRLLLLLLLLLLHGHLLRLYHHLLRSLRRPAKVKRRCCGLPLGLFRTDAIKLLLQLVLRQIS